MELYVLMLSHQGGYKAHSVHKTMDKAKSWAECKQQDGEDTSVLTLDEDTIDTITVFFEEAKEKK